MAELLGMSGLTGLLIVVLNCLMSCRLISYLSNAVCDWPIIDVNVIAQVRELYFGPPGTSWPSAHAMRISMGN